MKKNITLICFAVLLSFAILLSGCAASGDHETSAPAASGGEITSENLPATPSPETKGKSNVIVVWFSATGTTEEIARRIAEHLAADTYEIVPEMLYTTADLDYTDSGSRTSVEQSDATARPAIAGTLPDMQKYDTIFLGYPIWHGEAPRIISTFLDGCNLAQKTLIPFCTSGSSGIGSSADNLQRLTTNATWREGIRFAANVSDEELFVWADEIYPHGDMASQ